MKAHIVHPVKIVRLLGSGEIKQTLVGQCIFHIVKLRQRSGKGQARIGKGW